MDHQSPEVIEEQPPSDFNGETEVSGVQSETTVMSGRSRCQLLALRALPYTVVACAASVTIAIYLRPWSYPRRYVFRTGNDWLWQQAIFQMHADGGIFGSTKHVAWPIGASPWRLPQLGVLVGAWAKFSVGWLHLGTAAAGLWCLALIAGANAAAMLFLFRSVVGKSPRVLSGVVAFTFGVSVFVVGYQINLSALFPIPVVLGLLLRAPEMGKKALRGAAVCTAVIGFASPMWWIVVLALMLPFMALAPLLRRLWSSLRELAMIGGGLVIGLALQAVIFVSAASSGPGADTARGAWASNKFPGNTVSLMIGSPLLRKLLPGITDRLARGANGEPLLGVPLVIMAASALVLVIAVPPRARNGDRRTLVLSSATTVATLYWLGGGLGNLQAAFAVLLGTVSPARVWWRMAVVVAMLGAVWVIRAFETSPGPTKRHRVYVIVSSALAALLVVAAIGDLAAFDRRYTYSEASSYRQPVVDAVAFLRASVGPCPVAQFPNEAIPVSRIKPTGIIDPLTYTGFVPYVVEPSFFWSAGSYDPKTSTGLAGFPQALDDASLGHLRQLGYCALLFDKAQSANAIAQNVVIEGRELQVVRKPDFANERYALYLLK